MQVQFPNLDFIIAVIGKNDVDVGFESLLGHGCHVHGKVMKCFLLLRKVDKQVMEHCDMVIGKSWKSHGLL